jgi:hypothetical protein
VHESNRWENSSSINLVCDLYPGVIKIERFQPTNDMFHDDVHLNYRNGLPVIVKHLKIDLWPFFSTKLVQVFAPPLMKRTMIFPCGVKRFGWIGLNIEFQRIKTSHSILLVKCVGSSLVSDVGRWILPSVRLVHKDMGKLNNLSSTYNPTTRHR